MDPKIITGNRVFDNRGSLIFNNNLKFDNIKRFYIVHNYSKNFIRKWITSTYNHLALIRIFAVEKSTVHIEYI